ncbi:MAG: NUDIX hydrolase [Pseudonocardia sp.]
MRNVPIRTIHEQVAYQNRFITVMDDEVEFPDGSLGRYLRIVESEGRPGAAMLAECDGRFALVRTFRYALGDWEWAIPRGFAHGDDPLTTARRELVEELGAEPVEVVPVGTVTPDSGLLSATVHLVHARYDTEIAAPLDTDEVTGVRWVDLDTLRHEIRDGRIVDGFTLSALAAAAIHGIISL